MRSLVPIMAIATAFGVCQLSLARADWIESDERVWQDHAYCKSMGTQFGTMAYHECRRALSQQGGSRHSLQRRMERPHCGAGRRLFDCSCRPARLQ